MAKAKTIQRILAENGLAFASNMEPHYMEELEGIWNDACVESGGEITDARIDEYLDVLKKMGLAIPVHREAMEREHSRRSPAQPDPEVVRMRKMIQEEKVSERQGEPDLSRKAQGKLTGPGISGCGKIYAADDPENAASSDAGPDADAVYRIFPAQSKTDLGHKVFLILEVPDDRQVPHRIAGGFTNPQRRLAFEYYDGGERYHMSRLDMSGADIRFRKLFTWLGTHHICVRLSGTRDGNSFYVYRIKAVEPPLDGGNLQPFEDHFLQYMIERIRTSILQSGEEDTPEQMSMTTLPEIINFIDCCGDTLPGNIRQWARKNIITAGQDGGNADEKRHAQRALSMMLQVRWRSSYFDPIDPEAARRILDEELYGLEKVKQRVIETIIQINRTHTLPSYGLLLAGPAGTGKSQIAYAVARILKIPSAIFDMSTVRDPEALTGTPRIYTNARPGRIMEAFSMTGSSNIVFVINELDKADHDGQNGNPADTLLTLLDNLGFTDNYMECQIPTQGVYPIATANDKDRISDPLITRFAVIDIPDYTPEEKRIIFRDYSLPKVLRRMGMSQKECRVLPDAVDAIVDLYRERPGCRDLEQAAEHLAGHALYEIETGDAKKVVFDAAKARGLLEG
jgi:ATP-dependent Lon protease